MCIIDSLIQATIPRVNKFLRGHNNIFMSMILKFYSVNKNKLFFKRAILGKSTYFKRWVPVFTVIII